MVEGKMKGLSEKRLSDYMAEQIADEILAGRIEGGSQLKQEELAEVFGASRIPIREAFQVLESQGLIVRLATKRIYTVELDEEQIELIFEMIGEILKKAVQHVLNTNLSSCFYTSRLAVPLMLLKHSGRIINISSVWGNVGASMEVAYSASKGGVNSFTKALAKELAPSNIQVNAISCGVIDTAMNHCFSPEEMNALREEIPADRLGQPEEVAKLVLQLIQAPTYLTGQILTLDGGWQ